MRARRKARGEAEFSTRNPEEAKRLHAHALIEIEARWANLRGGAHVLTRQELEQASFLFCSAYVARWGNKEVENVLAALEFGADEKLWGKGSVADRFAGLPSTTWFGLTADTDGSAKSALREFGGSC